MSRDDELPDGVQDYPGIGWPVMLNLEYRDPRPVRVENVDLPETFHLSIFPSVEPPEWGLTLMYAVDDGVVLLSMVLAGGEEVPEVLDRIRAMRPLRWWQKRAVRAAAQDMLEHKTAMLLDGESPQTRSAPYDVQTLEPMRLAQVPLGRRRGRITEAHLEEVASVYRDAWERGENPTKAVAVHFGRPESTAADWVMRARKAQKLGKAQPGKAGV